MPRRTLLSALLSFSMAAPTMAASSAADPGEALREAARNGDLVLVRTLLERGVPVDAAARYGQTALYFAAEKGHLDLVRLLIDRGADVNVRDRFFRSSALELALGGGHLVLACLLLEKGAKDAAEALAVAIEREDLALARAALATGHLEPLELLALRRMAEQKGSRPLQDLLAAANVPRRERAPFVVSRERLQAYAGRYRAGEGAETAVSVRSDPDRLVLVSANEPEIVLVPVAEDRFENAAGDVAVAFGGRAGLVEWARLNRSGEVTRLSAVTADPKPLKVAVDTARVEKISRGAPRPWPSFRGPGASGVADGQGAPLAWDVKAGRNIAFRTPVPGIALSSPVVWGDLIFVTTAVSGTGDKTFRTGIYGDGTSVDDLSEHSFLLYALDRKTGRILWEREVHRGSPPVRRHMKSSQANATPVTDGQRVVTLFGSIGWLFAHDVQGKALWKREVGVLECNDPQSGSAQWGHASSPIVHGDLVIVQGDRLKDSFLAAYRLATGEEVWRVARDEPSTWATPNVLRSPAGDELITNGQKIRAYDPSTGRLLWTLGPSSEVVVATPVVGDGIAFLTAGYPPVRPVYAVRAGHRGDLSLPSGRSASEAIAWSHARGGTYIPTPIVYRGHLYTCNNNGILTCYRADTGEQVYQTRLGERGASFAASPVAADGRIYFASETGEVYVLRAGPEYELLATNVMDEVVMATPAISDGVLVIRTLGHVVGIAETDRPAASR